MLKAPEPPRNRTLTLALLGISVALAIAAGVVGRSKTTHPACCSGSFPPSPSSWHFLSLAVASGVSPA